MHPLASLVTTVDWFDTVAVRPGDADHLSVKGPASVGVPDDERNLVWQALSAHRARTGLAQSLRFELEKEIPAAAGLGGGSADAAATLALLDALAAASHAEEVAVGLGADVPFALTGGVAVLTGYGENIEPLEPHADFALAVVVPPIELSTPDVYGAWDDLGEPRGPAADRRWLPPSLRDRAPLANDLFPAALSIAPELGDWQADLASAWARPVLMSGSGSALFAFFSTLHAAVDAAAMFEGKGRAARAVTPTAVGARIIEG